MKNWKIILLVLFIVNFNTSGKSQNEITTFAHGKNTVASVHFLPDGKRLVSTSFDGTMILWDIPSGKKLWQVSPGNPKNDKNTIISHIFTGVTSPDGNHFAVSYDQSKIIDGWLAGKPEYCIGLFNLSDGSVQKQFVPLPERSLGLNFSPDGRLLAACGAEKKIRLWNVSTGQQIKEIDLPQGAYSIAFSPNSQYIAVGLGEPETLSNLKIESYEPVLIFQVQTGKKVVGLPIKSHYVVNVAFSSDGLLVALGQMPTTLTFWNPKTGELVKQYKNLEIDADNIFISSKERLLLLAENRERHGRVLAWDMQTNTKIRSFSWREPSSAIALSADGRLLAVGFESGKIRLLRL